HRRLTSRRTRPAVPVKDLMPWSWVMEELMRFQQLRPLQTISDEQASLLGMTLYPKSKLTAFAQGLVDAKDRDSYLGLINRYAEASHGGNLISDPSKLHPFIKSLYDWFAFKARPIKKDDFAKFLKTLKTGPNFVLEHEWSAIADNFLVAIERNQ